MKKAAYNILSSTEDILKTMGEQIKLVREIQDLNLVAGKCALRRK